MPVDTTHSKGTPLPAGFSAAGIHCGVKPGALATKLDLALFASDRSCSAGGVFTTNLVCGAPVKVSRDRLPRATARALVINSGNANACTGEQGIADARRMTALIAERLNCAGDDVLVCSTGVIGRFLPMEKIAASIPQVVAALGSAPENLLTAAQAIMTTDTVHKLSTRIAMIGGKQVRITGVCKGAAMIAPNMATMLCGIFTDCVLSPEQCQSAIRVAVADSFNCISVDGHESTSDSVILLANGATGVTPTLPGDVAAFQQALDEVAQDLAMAIIRDAEGADHFVQIDVTGTRTRDEAFKIATAVANSALVKTAICGADPNWGRIVSAAGYAGVVCREEDMTLILNGYELYRDGTPLAFDAAVVSQSLRQNREVHIDLRLKIGAEKIRFWTSDLTKAYVELNADYTT